jgi:hypothetical protein
MRRSSCGSLAIAACALSWCVPAVTGQDTPPDVVGRDSEIRSAWAIQWLRSDSPLDIAWGAWLTRVDRQQAAVPLLVKQLSGYRPPEDLAAESRNSDRHDAMLQVLDALIELRVPVPVEDAHKLFGEFAAQSLILLVRPPDDQQAALFDIFDRASANWNWLAAGNALLKTRSPGFTAKLVARFTEHLQISVWDPGFGGGTGGGGSECGFSLRAPKRGWPPVGLFQLTQFPDRIPWLSTVFLIGGETPVYYWRAEPGNYDNPPDVRGACDDGNRDEYRAQYLMKLVPPFPRIALDAYPNVRLEWRGDILYQQEFAAAVEKQLAQLRSGVASLQQSQLLAPSPALANPRLETVIDDERRDKSVPLPSVRVDKTVGIRTAFSKPLP